jgi:adenine deaminase
MGSDTTTGTDLIDRLPKCELHIHVEGSLEPELLFALARRNGVSLAYDSVEALRRAYQFSRLQDFLDIYYQGMSVLRTERDFYDLGWAYLERARRVNVRYLEMFFDPQGHTARGVPFAHVIDGLHRAAADAAARLGIEARLILCFLRHLDEADAERTLDEALEHREKFIGVGLDSTEAGHPPEKFARVFRRARDAGLFLTAHAGEEGPPEYIWQALDVLGVERVDHGNRAIEDGALLARLARDRVPLTMCPLSNLRLCVTPDLARHPLKAMMEKDILVTVNSDDPAYFGGGLGENFRAIRDALRLDDREIAAITRNGWSGAFMNDDAKVAALVAFDNALAGPG